MMWELPKEFKTVRGSLAYSTTDTGDRHVVFMIEGEDMEMARAGRIAGLIIPPGVDKRHLDQVIGEIREIGLRVIIVPPQTLDPAQPAGENG